MRSNLFKLNAVALGVWLACISVRFVTGSPQAMDRPAAASAQESLRVFLQGYLKTIPYHFDKSTRYSPALVDLNGDGKLEAIVYISGDGWCGSGGCGTLILAAEDGSWRVVTKLTITWPPIRVLTTASNGWRDIALWVQGGGIQPGYEAELRFNGKTYPRNPAAAPARRLKEKVEGEVVVRSEDDGTPLYP